MFAPRCTPKKPKVPSAFRSAAHPPVRNAAGAAMAARVEGDDDDEEEEDEEETPS